MPKDKKVKKGKDNYYQFDDARTIKDSIVIKRLSKYAIPHWRKFIFIIITVLISSFLMAYLSKAFGAVIDILGGESITNYINASKSNFDPVLLYIYRTYGNSLDAFGIILHYAFFILGAIVISSVLSYFRGISLNRVGQKILVDVRNELFSHIENLSLKELDKTAVGTFVTRVTNDTNALSDLFTNVLVTLVSESMTMIYAIILMFIASWRLSLIAMAVMVALAFATFIFRYYSRRQFRMITYDNAKLNAFLSENLSGMKITQIFNREEAKLQEFDMLSDRLKKSHGGSTLIFAIFRPSIFFLYFCAVVLVFYVGSKFVLDPLMPAFTAGTLYSFYLYLQNLFNPIQNIAQQYNAMQNAFASAEKIFHVFDTSSSITFIDNPVKADNFRGEIEFKDVWFKYDEEWIIKGISFHVMPGETVAFVGPTGAGKTTILSLIERYYDVDKGEILIDGINVKDYDIHSLRKNIGEMLQDVFLFTGTIKDNITLRDETISDDDVIKSSEYVNADKFINRLPDKYDEKVKERGNNYSQGERQLLSFARTIVHKPKMIILDEATSNIDTETEVLIQDSLEKIKTIGTTIMVAHRLSTIQHSDIIMFIDAGQIVEAGSHQDLLKLKGRYYGLYELQYEGKSKEKAQ